MAQNILDFFAKRHSFYRLNDNIPFSYEDISHWVEENLKFYPSPFNSQSARLILLSGENHKKLWDITLQKLLPLTNGTKVQALKDKMAQFAQAYGTVLFYIDTKVVQSLKDKFPLYASNFDNWSYQTNAILQFMIWTTFANHSIGANLQHYNPVIDVDVQKAFDVPSDWVLVAQMPFGGIVSTPEAHAVEDIKKSLVIK